MKDKKIRRLIIVLFIIVVAVAGIWLWQSLNHRTSDKGIVLYGNVDIRQVDLAFNANERILQVLAEEGDRVEKGKLLATLETNRLLHEVARARAQARSREQNCCTAGSRQPAGGNPQSTRRYESGGSRGKER